MEFFSLRSLVELSSSLSQAREGENCVILCYFFLVSNKDSFFAFASHLSISSQVLCLSLVLE